MTRSITHIHEAKAINDKENVVCSFYRHHDGYPEGHGKDIGQWLEGKKLVNGISGDFKKGRDFNRAGTMNGSYSTSFRLFRDNKFEIQIVSKY